MIKLVFHKFNNVVVLQSINIKAASNDVYNKSGIDQQKSSLIGAASAILNTIVELATAFGNDSNYATIVQNQLNTKVNINETHTKYEINVASGILQIGTDTRVLINAVDINGNFKINAVSTDMLKVQRVDVTT